METTEVNAKVAIAMLRTSFDPSTFSVSRRPRRSWSEQGVLAANHGIELSNTVDSPGTNYRPLFLRPDSEDIQASNGSKLKANRA